MSKRKLSPLRVARLTIAGAVMALFIVLFADPSFIDPEGSLRKALSFLPKMQFWPAVLSINIGMVLLWVVLSFVLGRVYCSAFCPMGILQDIIYRIRISGGKRRRFRQKFSKPLNPLRYAVLAVFIVAAALASGATAYLIEPYSIFGRMMSSFTERAIPLVLISAVTLALLVFLVWKWGRIWCNTVCPVGSILSIPARHSLFSPVINLDKCVSCGLCGKACRAGCIDTKNHRVDTSRCILCMDCLDNCNEGAIEYKWRLAPAKAPGKTDGASAAESLEKAPEKGRRAFLAATALTAGTLGAKAAASDDIFGILETKTPPQRKTRLVPPGSGSLRHFEDHCVGCQLCVEACPNKVLHPSLDPEHLLQPQMDFDKGWCRVECTACSEVCPAGVIKKITPEAKTSVSVGYAVYNPELCLVNTEMVECGNCARHCPAGAISMTRMEGADDASGWNSRLRVPSVNPERCIGCGRCEYVCPTRPVSAITVEGREVHREI